MKQISCWSIVSLILSFLLAQISAPATAQPIGKIERKQIHSKSLEDNLIGASSTRTINVYLPPGYAASSKRYPVVYYFHNLLFNADRLFNETPLLTLIDRAIQSDRIDEFILVAADFSTPQLGSLYENSVVSGRWLDFISRELVPFIDQQYRTIDERDSRAAIGDFMGGRGALKLGMSYAAQFSVVYAMHPVATGIGTLPWADLDVNWNAIRTARNFTELAGKGRSQIFIGICQAFLPNASKPPFYCDFFFDVDGVTPKLNPANVQKAKGGFLLSETLYESADNLRSLKGLAFDWGRFDQTEAHVFSNQAFSRMLTDLDVKHEAEEYNGGPFDKTWLYDGRFYTRVIPFLQSHLRFTK
ncbi:alpha/beta hydrolase-fold protein [Chryseolinea sp. T2]|uniref:alpha/beta hydrolase n=1 Tax=Chryseolinea sp. T2 TaxID=3129255 RepID=UPI00307894CA